MPFYEYRCSRCEGIFEQMRPIARRDEPAPCPSCGESAERLVSRISVCKGVGPCGDTPSSCGMSEKGGHSHGGGCCCGCH